MIYPRVLTIAGSDSGGGAGIQADIKSISATGSYAASAITAVTVQNTLGVENVHAVPVDILSAQIRCVLSDIGADAVKIGMLHSPEVVLAVRDALQEAVREGWLSTGASGRPSIVLDPVMVSTSGHRLIEDSAIEVLQRELMPIARIITPNLPEAEVLWGRSIASEEDFPEAARALSCGGTVSVLMKAGHLDGAEVSDILYNAENDSITMLRHPRIDTPNTHGTGCTLSSAIASYLAQGLELEDAVRAGTDYIYNAIASGAAYSIGHGHGPVNHFWKA